MRCLKKQPFLVMEQQPGRVNWRAINSSHNADQLEFWVKQSFAHGAFGSLIFRFRQLPFGAEQFHTGLLDYDGEPTERAKVFSRVIQELSNWDAVVPQREAAIYYDYENFWINETDNLNNRFDLLLDAILPVYRAVRNLGYNVDFVFPGDTLEGYSVAFVPSSLKLERSFVEELKRFRGKVFFTALTDQKDGHNFIKKSEDSFLEELIGIRIGDAGGIEETVKISFADRVFAGSFVAERVLPGDDCEILGVYLDGPYPGHPALVRSVNKYYLSSVPQTEFLESLLVEAGIRRRLDGLGRITRTGSHTILLNSSSHKTRPEVDGKAYSLKEYEVRKI
jgi:beta-galactosidase